MAPCEPRLLLQSTGEESSPMMKTMLQRIRVELAILGKKKNHYDPRLNAQMSKVLRSVKRTATASFDF